jgi:hypothetical protein
MQRRLALPWSEAEEERLAELVEKHGCRWVLIQGEGRDAFQDRRTAVS